MTRFSHRSIGHLCLSPSIFEGELAGLLPSKEDVLVEASVLAAGHNHTEQALDILL